MIDDILWSNIAINIHIKVVFQDAQFVECVFKWNSVFRANKMQLLMLWFWPLNTVAALNMTLNCKQYPSNSDKPCLSSSTCVSDLNTKLTGSHQVKHSYHWITAQRNKIQNRPEHPFIHPSLHSSLHPGAQRWICSPSHDLKWTLAIPKLCSGRGLTVENKPRPWNVVGFSHQNNETWAFTALICQREYRAQVCHADIKGPSPTALSLPPSALPKLH